MRYYYKSKKHKNYFTSADFEMKDDDLIAITESEYNESTKTSEPSETMMRISELKQKLADTDYQAIKYAEGLISEEDYSSIKAQRQSWRDEINKLEK